MKTTKLLLAITIPITLLTLVACNTAQEISEQVLVEETVAPLILTLPEFTVDAPEQLTDYFDVIEIETDEIIHELLDDGGIDELELDEDAYEAVPAYIVPAFTFLIETDSDAPLPSDTIVTNERHGVIVFDDLTFDEEGEFTYTIFQELDDEDEWEDWKLDEAIFTIEIVVELNKDIHELEATLKLDEEIIFFNELIEVEDEEEDIEDDDTEASENEQSDNASDTSIDNTHINTSSDNTSYTSVDNAHTNTPSNHTNTNHNTNTSNNNSNTNNNTNNNSNSNNNNNTPTCTDVWVETSPARAAVPGTPAIDERWEMTPPQIVHQVNPYGHQFPTRQEAVDWIRANGSGSVQAIDIGSQWVLVQPYVPAIPGSPAIPAQGRWECR